MDLCGIMLGVRAFSTKKNNGVVASGHACAPGFRQKFRASRRCATFTKRELFVFWHRNTIRIGAFGS